MSVRGALNLIVLKILSNGDYTGSELIREIEKITESWKPSPGSIYPLMNTLVEKGFASFKQKKNQKIYSMTLRGRIFYIKAEAKKNKIITELNEGINFLRVLEETRKTA